MMKKLEFTLEELADEFLKTELRTIDVCINLLEKTGISGARDILTGLRDMIKSPNSKEQILNDLKAINKLLGNKFL